eukprot:scaffold28030_cov72-Phaeocystis_antarctica.AAC.11
MERGALLKLRSVRLRELLLVAAKPLHRRLNLSGRVGEDNTSRVNWALEVLDSHPLGFNGSPEDVALGACVRDQRRGGTIRCVHIAHRQERLAVRRARLLRDAFVLDSQPGGLVRLKVHGTRERRVQNIDDDGRAAGTRRVLSVVLLDNEADRRLLCLVVVRHIRQRVDKLHPRRKVGYLSAGHSERHLHHLPFDLRREIAPLLFQRAECTRLTLRPRLARLRHLGTDWHGGLKAVVQRTIRWLARAGRMHDNGLAAAQAGPRWQPAWVHSFLVGARGHICRLEAERFRVPHRHLVPFCV